MKNSSNCGFYDRRKISADNCWKSASRWDYFSVLRCNFCTPAETERRPAHTWNPKCLKPSMENVESSKWILISVTERFDVYLELLFHLTLSNIRLWWYFQNHAASGKMLKITVREPQCTWQNSPILHSHHVVIIRIIIHCHFPPTSCKHRLQVWVHTNVQLPTTKGGFLTGNSTKVKTGNCKLEAMHTQKTHFCVNLCILNEY